MKQPGVVIMTTPQQGDGRQEMRCLPLGLLPAWQAERSAA